MSAGAGLMEVDLLAPFRGRHGASVLNHGMHVRVDRAQGALGAVDSTMTGTRGLSLLAGKHTMLGQGDEGTRTDLRSVIVEIQGKYGLGGTRDYPLLHVSVVELSGAEAVEKGCCCFCPYLLFAARGHRKLKTAQVPSLRDSQCFRKCWSRRKGEPTQFFYLDNFGNQYRSRQPRKSVLTKDGIDFEDLWTTLLIRLNWKSTVGTRKSAGIVLISRTKI